MDQLIGEVPGTLRYTGDFKSEPFLQQSFIFDESQLVESDQFTGEFSASNWLKLSGMADVPRFFQSIEKFKISKLLLEDTLNTQMLSKSEHRDRYVFVLLKMMNQNQVYKEGPLSKYPIEQVALILDDEKLISITEKDDDQFQRIIKRIQNGEGIVRKKKSDYLFCLLVDAMVDSFYRPTMQLDHQIHEFEKKIFDYESKEALQITIYYQNEVNRLLRAFAPMKDVVFELSKKQGRFVTEENLVYLKDAYDHALQITEILRYHLDKTRTLFNIIVSMNDFKMNEIMKTLTLISTFFLPLSFIAAVYGMNFKNMPELDYQYGYYYILLLMFALALSIFLYAKRRKWFQ